MAKAPKMTFKRLQTLVEEGVGTGHGESYQPFLQIKRWNPSPVSTQVLSALPPYERSGHFFSLSEWCLAMLVSWAGCWVREQFPLWPWPHPHPHYDLGDEWGGASLPESVGMQALCRSAGIRHGVFPGTKIPYIWTIDLALSLPWVEDPAHRCVFISVKPLESERYSNVDPLDRGAQKLEMERRYTKEMGIGYFIGDSSIFPNELWANLDWLRTCASPPHPVWATALQRFLEHYGDTFSERPISELMRRLARDYSVPPEVAQYLIHHCLWHQKIDCDLSRYLNMSKPPKPGGRRLIQQFRAALMEGFA